MLISWSHYLSASPEAPSQILSQFLWYNNSEKIEDAVIHFEKFSNKNINFSLQLFQNGRIISWVNLKDEYELTNDMFFQRAQLKNAIPTRWKALIFNFSVAEEKNLYQNHHIVKEARILSTYTLSSKEMKPISSIYFKILFQNITLDWSKIHLLPRLATNVLSNTKFSITYSFSIKNYTLLE